jgi:hypothetical protein
MILSNPTRQFKGFLPNKKQGEIRRRQGANSDSLLVVQGLVEEVAGGLGYLEETTTTTIGRSKKTASKQ